MFYNAWKYLTIGLTLITFGLIFGFLAGCITPSPPKNIDNICYIFKQYPAWYKYAHDVEKRWRVPVHIQMAIVHQESKFEANARPKRKQILGFIPGARPSSAYGYAQALDNTWEEYKKFNGGWPSRRDFSDGVDFIGWYADLANQRAGISRKDAYSLYLAYHEGVGGYQRKTYKKKPWLMQVAKKVQGRSELYKKQLQTCRPAEHSFSLWKK